MRVNAVITCGTFAIMNSFFAVYEVLIIHFISYNSFIVRGGI